MIQQGGAVVIQMLENVRQVTIRPLIERFIAPGTGYIPMNTTFTAACQSGVSTIGRYTTARANTPAMTTATAFTRSMSTPPRGSGRCCARGCNPIGEFHKKNCRSTWLLSPAQRQIRRLAQTAATVSVTIRTVRIGWSALLERFANQMNLCSGLISASPRKA